MEYLTVPGEQRVEGYGRILRAPNECQYFYRRRGVDYRGPAPGYWTGAWWVPEELERNELEWETAPCPAVMPTMFSFVAAAAMAPPEYSVRPLARLYFNDELALIFEPGAIRDRVWQAGEFSLKLFAKTVQWPYDVFDRRFEMAGNSALYELRVPARCVRAGEPCRVRVELLPYPRWPRMWFMIKERSDTLREADPAAEINQLRDEVQSLKQMVHVLAEQIYRDHTGQAGMRHQIIYTDGYQHLLSPDLAQLKDGTWLLCFRVGSEHTSLDGDVLFMRSSDEGRTWSSPEPLAAAPDLDEREGGIVELADGRWLANIFLNRMYDAAGRYLESHGLHSGILNMATTFSYDQGRTWSRLEEMNLEGMPFDCVEAPASPPILLPDGTILQLVTAYNLRGNRRGSGTALVASRDGAPWELRAMVAEDPDGTRGGFWEGSLVRTPSGALVAAMRNQAASPPVGSGEDSVEGVMQNSGAAQVLWSARSVDGGHTWSQAQPTPMVGHPADLICLRSGALLCTYGFRPDSHGEPAGIRACLSYDEGRTWDSENEMVLRQDFFNFDIGYPASLQRQDGSIFSVYYYNLMGKFFIGGTEWQLPAQAR